MRQGSDKTTADCVRWRLKRRLPRLPNRPARDPNDLTGAHLKRYAIHNLLPTVVFDT